MSTPTLRQARSHYDRQRRITAAAIVAVRALFKRRAPLLEVASTVARYQMASAAASAQSVAAFAGDSVPLTNPAAFAGVSSAGFPISEPIVATIDRFVPAPLEPLPDAWWDEAAEFMASVEQVIASEVQDAGRSASQTEFVARPNWQNYVRMLTPPSCARCAILAGRVYRDLESFKRHPLCDCVMVPVQDWQDAHDKGLVSSAQDLFDRGEITGMSWPDRRAVLDGADIVAVVNAGRGTRTVDVLGKRTKITVEGTTPRAVWRTSNPSRLVRLRPEAIYKFAKDRDDAIRLLKLYGYIT